MYASGKLLWEDETWHWLPGESPEKSLPEEIKEAISKQMETLTPQQMTALRLLVIFNQEIPLSWMTEIFKNPAAFPTKETIGEMMAKNPVCVVSPLAGYCPDYLLDGERYDFVKTRPIYRVVEKK